MKDMKQGESRTGSAGAENPARESRTGSAGADNAIGRIDEIARQSLLYDYYGQLLSPRQREVMELYTEENLSLQEIAEQFGISRQGVHDALRNGQRALDEYENKLGLVERFLRTEEAVEQIDARIQSVIDALKEQDHAGQGEDSRQSSANAVRELQQIRRIIDQLGEE